MQGLYRHFDPVEKDPQKYGLAGREEARCYWRYVARGYGNLRMWRNNGVAIKCPEDILKLFPVEEFRENTAGTAGMKRLFY